VSNSDALIHLNAAQPSLCGSPRSKPADEKFQVNGFLRISVSDGFKKFADGDFHAEFLADFTHQALLEGFVRFALATGKFPQAAEMRIGMAPGYEQFAAAENQGAETSRDVSRAGIEGRAPEAVAFDSRPSTFDCRFTGPTLL